MDRFDLVTLIGKQTCSAASHLTQFLASEPACTKHEVWNMGAFAVIATVVILVMLVIRERRRATLD